MPTRSGYRGYIASRPILRQLTTQRIQNLVIRDYASQHNLTYLLSATEYAMPACYMMLEEVLSELPKIEGIIAFSFFMLPENRERRHAFYQRTLAAGATFHAALEGLSLNKKSDIEKLEDIYVLRQITPHIHPDSLLPLT